MRKRAIRKEPREQILIGKKRAPTNKLEKYLRGKN